MMDVKNFSAEQIEQLKKAVAQGLGLAATQKYINDELNIPINYMDTRFLIADLNLELYDKNAVLKQEAKEKAEKELAQTAEGTAEVQTGAEAQNMNENPHPEQPQQTNQGGLQVTKDNIQRPGAVANGTVVFSDGEKASWYITPEGQLGLDSTTANYQPSEPDIVEFQTALKQLLT